MVSVRSSGFLAGGPLSRDGLRFDFWVREAGVFGRAAGGVLRVVGGLTREVGCFAAGAVFLGVGGCTACAQPVRIDVPQNVVVSRVRAAAHAAGASRSWCRLFMGLFAVFEPITPLSIPILSDTS